ncbi:hypothetical protein SLEP1_g27496 [Rubroshorea leprosula]|uniref:Protein kinase domain-containing protein n=1 Tax=Rubroshorea leprosula TaxID=152421 RepID=A0AAV5JQL6_9ROSI|nr:hypothetical protein SLEP1_g27496 [Rubroshorea leprosula]
MLILTIFFISLLHLLHPTTATFPYNATDIILLDCGAQSNTISKLDGRNWDTDISSRYSSFNDQKSSIPSIASHQDPSIPTSAYASDRACGLLDQRIHFTVRNREMLNVTFIPSPKSFAFINGIEIVSMPSGLYLSGREIPQVTPVAGQFFFLDNTTTSLETLYRLNVGGNPIENVNDTGMYRTWSPDGDYLVRLKWYIPVFLAQCLRFRFLKGTPEYTAAKEVYTTTRMMSPDASLNSQYNMTWKFSVDAGFHYLVSLHFCELLNEVRGRDQHVFSIFINNQTAETNIDVFLLSGGYGYPMYRDYIVMADNSTQGKDLWLALHPQNKKYVDALLNGLEIFKLNQSDGNLAGPNPDSHQKLLEGPESRLTSIILPVIGAILGGFALVSLLVSFFIFQRQRKLKHSLSFTSKFLTTKTSSSLLSDIYCHFSIAEIKAATQDFDDALLIGSGGFGNVYRGIMKGGTTIAAIKRLNPSSRRGAHEFRTEIALLSKVRHMNLVSLIGYCDDQSEMIRVR